MLLLRRTADLGMVPDGALRNIIRLDFMTSRVRFVPFLCIAALLISTYRLYTSAFFWIDDFNNLFWVQRQSASAMLWDVINPASKFFRPTGMLFYWVLLHLFGLDERAYHVVAWLLHATNTALVYVILKRITASRAGAAIGAMFYACEAAFVDLYWSFGTIFELVCALAMLTGILLWNTEDRSWRRALLCLFVFAFALKAKEMAITLPALWLVSDLTLRSKLTAKNLLQLVPATVLGVFYGLMKVPEMRGGSPADPYYMDIRSITLGRGFGGYFNLLFNTGIRWQIWAIGFVSLLLVFVFLKMRPAIFFQAYTFISFLPLIFLVNHREAFYWYLPIFGLCGLAALLVKSFVAIVEPRLPRGFVPLGATAVFALLCWGTYVLQRDQTVERRQWQQHIAAEYRAFVASVQAMPQPAPNGTIVFESHPEYFDSDVLRYASSVALRRTDIDAKLVSPQ